MTPREENVPTETTILMNAPAMAAHLRRMTAEIIENNADIEALALLGILRRGRPMADRIAALIEELTGVRPPVGSLATTLYRDDLRAGAGPLKARGATHFDFAVDDRTVLLVDDVLAAGRTIRAAMDEVMDYGRPARIQLACLVDRGRRELPIRADYLGLNVATDPRDWVSVRFTDIDGEDAVLLERPAAKTGEGV